MASAAGSSKRSAPDAGASSSKRSSPDAGPSSSKSSARSTRSSKNGRITTGRAGSGSKELKASQGGGTRSSAPRSGSTALSTGFVTGLPAAPRPTAPSARPAAPRPATPNVPTPGGLTAAQQQLARVRRRLDAIANRQQLRLTALRALQDNVRTATALVAQATQALPAPPQLPELSTGTIRITDTNAGMSYEQLLLRVFSEHMRLGEAAARPAVEADADAIADTVAELLAALPEFDGPWGPAIGPVYRTEQVRALLGGVSRQALSDRVKRSTLLALKTRDVVTVYPAWQFSEGQVLSGLPQVLKLFAADEHGEIVDAWSLASWLRASLDELGGDSVSGRLRAGEQEAAVAAARSAAARWSR